MEEIERESNREGAGTDSNNNDGVRPKHWACPSGRFDTHIKEVGIEYAFATQSTKLYRVIM